jgi:hypothetical protein
MKKASISEDKTLRVKNALRKDTPDLYIYGLFNVCSSSDYTASNGRMVSKTKKAVVTKFEALLCGGAEERPGNISVSITSLRTEI